MSEHEQDTPTGAGGKSPDRDPERDPEAGPRGDSKLKLADAEKQAAENWERFLRARADLENYRKRVQRDLAAMVRREKKGLVLHLLEVVDALERAASWQQFSADREEAATPEPSAPVPQASAEGVALIHRQLLKVLADEGVAPIEGEGQLFDPALHEAVATDNRDDIPPGTVTAELTKGYTYEGEVLRPARVRVNQPG